MQEYLPTIISTNTTACTPDTGGEAQDVVMDFGQGDGARIVMVEFCFNHSNASHSITYGLSVDPNEAAPALRIAILENTSVLCVVDQDYVLTTSGATNFPSYIVYMYTGVYVVTRNLAFIGYSAGSFGDTAHVRVHYNQVKFNEAELRAITITNR